MIGLGSWSLQSGIIGVGQRLQGLEFAGSDLRPLLFGLSGVYDRRSRLVGSGLACRVEGSDLCPAGPVTYLNDAVRLWPDVH